MHFGTTHCAPWICFRLSLAITIDSYRQLASLVKTSFNKRFWNENTGCLYDVVDEDDDTIRPNQIYAVSLPFTMPDMEREKAIVDTVMDKLYVAADCVRSILTTRITIDYIGSLSKRDHAYHQGTAWGFLLGGFISAYVKVNGRTKATALCADKLLDPVRSICSTTVSAQYARYLTAMPLTPAVAAMRRHGV